VVNVRKGPSTGAHVAAAAAQLLLELIRALAPHKSDGTVHVGLGAGNTTLTVCRKLADLLRAELRYPPLVLHALTSFWDNERPLSAPTAFFSLFDPDKVKCVGLFAAPVSRCEDYQRTIMQDPWLKDLFESSRKEVDVIMFSLAQADDPHGLV